jgi:hypothetical protein
MTPLEVKRIGHAHCIIPGLSKAVKITARASNFNWGHLTKRKKSYARNASCQLKAYELADRLSKKTKYGPVLICFLPRPDVQLKRTST